jgi:hypothetical protein
MTKTIWYTGTDGGDGSVGVSFYESRECIRLLEEYMPEYYRGEGGSYFTVEGECDIVPETMEDVIQEIIDMCGYEDDWKPSEL